MRTILLLLNIIGLLIITACSGKQENADVPADLTAAKTQTSISIQNIITQTPVIILDTCAMGYSDN